MKLCKLLLLLIMLVMCFGCLGGGEQSSSGSGSEIVGDVDSGSARIVFNNNRTAVDNAKIYLFKSDYKADGSEDTVTTSISDGSFRIDSTVTEDNIGLWLLEATTPEYSLLALCNVKGDGEQIDLGTIKITEKASLSVTIKTDIPTDTEIDYSLYVLGTRIYADGDGDSLVFKVDDIPTGPYGFKHTLMLEVRKPFPTPLILKEDIVLIPGSNKFEFEVNKP